jgi:predicted MFS family arabinose efflux permease
VKALSLLLLYLATNEWHVYASQVLSGMAAAFFSGTVEAILYESLKEDRREEEMAKVYGKIEGAAMLPKIAGLVLGAWLAKDLTITQFHILIGLNLCLVLLQIFFILRIIEPPGLEQYRDHPWSHVKKGTRVIIENPGLLYLFANVTMIFIGTNIFTNFEQPWFQRLGFPVEALGIVFAAGYLLSYLASTCVGWLTKKVSEVAWIYLSGVLIIASYVLTVIFDHSTVVFILAVLVIRAARSIRWPISSNLGNQYISTGSRATTLSLLSILNSVFDVVLIGSLAVVSKWGIPEIFWGCAVISLLGLLFPVRKKARLSKDEAGLEAERSVEKAEVQS